MLEDLIDATRERVRYKPPEEVISLNKMPMAPTGKVDRAALKRWAQEAQAAGGA